MPDNVQVELSEFRADAERYVSLARDGDRVVVEAGGVVLAHVVPPSVIGRVVPWGALAGQITMSDDFDEHPP